MTIQVTEIIENVRRRIRQPLEAQSNWNDEDLFAYINAAIRDIVRSTRSYRTYAEYTGNGNRRFPLPSNLLTIEAVLGPGGQVPAINISDAVAGRNMELYELDYRGPHGYIVKGDYIYFLPSLPTGSVRYVHYVGYPDKITSTGSSVDLPLHMLNAIVFKTAADLMTEIGNMTMADRMEAKFSAELPQIANQEVNRQYPSNRLRRPLRPRR